MTEIDPTPRLTLFNRIVLRLAGLVAGVAVAMALLIAVELYSSVVHPFPADYKGTKEEIVAHVARYPQWVLATAVPMWAFTAYASTWVARRVGGRVVAIVVGLLLTIALLCNLSMLPYPIWFKVAVIIVIPAAIVGATRQTKK